MVTCYNNLLEDIRPVRDIPLVACDHRPDRSFFLGDTMKKIPLTQGQFAIVDDEDYEALSKVKWYASKTPNTYYANRCKEKRDGKQIKVPMHRQILNAPSNLIVDHINHDGLDNRRENLRLCTHTDNMRNRKINYNNRSGFKGVTWDKTHKKWRPNIQVDGKDMFLGYHFCIIKAAKIYDENARKFFGDFAKTNF